MSNSRTSITSFEWVTIVLMVGALTGAAFGVFDVYAHAANFLPIDVLWACAFAAMAAVPTALAIACVCRALARCAGVTLSREQWCAVMNGAALFALCVTVLVIGSFQFHNWVGVLLVLAAAGSGAIAYGLTLRARVFARAGGALLCYVLVLATLIGVGVICAGFRVLNNLHYGSLTAILLGLIGIALAFAVSRPAQRRAVCCAAVLLVGLGVSGASLRGPRPAAAAATATARTGLPNVVLIVLDTTRRDRLGCYGNEDGLTPALDGVAREGVVYEDAYSTAPWTTPSHASMLTGLFPSTHGCSNEHHLWLEDAFVTLPEMLHELGYQTVSFNSNYLLERSTSNVLQGFDARYQLEGSHTVDHMTLANAARLVGFPARWADKGGGEAVLALKTWLAKRHDPSRPAFFFINLLDAHEPYQPPLSERRAGLPDDVAFSEAARFGRDFSTISAHFQGLDDARSRRIAAALYDGGIRYQDRMLAELLGLIAGRVDLDNTLLIITADHGENLGAARRWGHQFALNDDLIHVPLIIRYPGAAYAGERVGGLCQNIDLIPTVFDVLKREAPLPNLPGVTLAPNKFTPREFAFAQLYPFYLHVGRIQQELGMRTDVHAFLEHLRTIRMGTWKYLWASDGNGALFDLRRDPLEQHDLSERFPAVAADLAARLDQEWKKQPKFTMPKTNAPASLERDALLRLRALGYVE